MNLTTIFLSRIVRSALVLTILVIARNALSATIAVTPGATDPDANTNTCTLVEAIRSAENNNAYGSGCPDGDIEGFDTLVLPEGSVYSFAEPFGENSSVSALPTISTDINLQGNGAIIERDQNSVDDFRLIHVNSTGTFILDQLTLRGGNADDSSTENGRNGGAIFNNGGDVIITRSVISNNRSARDGGGINNLNGNLTLTDSTVSDNLALDDGGGIDFINGNLTILKSTISGNHALGNGGGLRTHDATGQSINVAQSTLSNNIANGEGGGLLNILGLTQISYCTITGNSAGQGLGAGVAQRGINDPETQILATVVAGNANDDDVASTLGEPNPFTSLGDNLIGYGNSALAFNVSGDQTGVTDPGLQGLRQNGGYTATHLLLVESLAVDAVSGNCEPLEDQRGNLRPQNAVGSGYARCDIGAVEMIAGSLVDSDHDGIPDSYENANNLSPTGDFDSDGTTDLSEYIQGTEANSPDTDGDGLGDQIDLAPLTESNQCIPDGNGNAVLANFTAEADVVTQCAAPNSIRVLNAGTTRIRRNSILQLYTLKVFFDGNAIVPLGASLEVTIGDPTPGVVR